MGYSPRAIRQIYDYVHRVYPDVQNGGIFANKAGYHNSRNGNRALGRPNDYSMGGAGQPPADRRGNSDAASAIDLTPKKASTQHMLSKRLYAVLQRDDPRCWPVREFFGSFDGNGVDGWSRWLGRRISSDLSHEWHIHLSFYREFADDEDAMLGVAEIICGVPLSQSKTKHGPKGAPAPKPITDEEEIMALDPKTLDAIAEAVLDHDSIANTGGAFTANADNPNVTVRTALNALGKRSKSQAEQLARIEQQQAEILAAVNAGKA